MKNKILVFLLCGLFLNMLSAPVYAYGFENFICTNQTAEFTDVTEDSWYYAAVLETSACGIVNGVGENLFNPGGSLTHAEAMTLMAKTYAIYYGKTEGLAKVQSSGTGTHWADSILNFCIDNNLPYPGAAELDEPITRETMAHYFYKALPGLAFNAGISNDLENMPEKITNSTVKSLFKSGVMVGDENGFRLKDYITRAEAAAIIQRVAKPDARVKISGKTETVEIKGEIQTDKPYKRIPNTEWSADPTGGVEVKAHSGNINTRYGKHSYGCANQREYDRVMSLIDEAFLNACKEEAKEDASFENKEFLEKEVGITARQEMANIVITQGIVENMRKYLADTYAIPNGAGEKEDFHNNNVHKYLFSGGTLDCDGNGYLNMLCWDYLGFSTRMITSIKIAHATSQVYVNGHWIMLNQDNGRFDFCTHEQLLELIYGIKNDAYSAGDDADAMIKGASEAIDNGKTAQRPDDLEIWEDETPTHDTENTSVI